MSFPRTRFIPALALVWACAAGAADIVIKPGAYAEKTEIVSPDLPKPMVIDGEECFTPEQARSFYSLLLQEIAKDDDCMQVNEKIAGNKIAFDMVCPDIGGSTTSQIEMTFGPDWYKAQVTTRVDGQLMTVKLDGKWVRATCSK